MKTKGKIKDEKKGNKTKAYKGEESRRRRKE